jgi:hypothetical protein
MEDKFLATDIADKNNYKDYLVVRKNSIVALLGECWYIWLAVIISLLGIILWLATVK